VSHAAHAEFEQQRHVDKRIQDTRRDVLRLNAVLNQNPGSLDRCDFLGGLRLNPVLSKNPGILDDRDFIGHQRCISLSTLLP
jgi:hypothetical protein